MPGDHRQFARCCDSGDLLATPAPDSKEERAQRARRVGGRPCGFHQHRAGVGAPDLADVSVLGRLQARLAHPRVEPEVAHQLGGACKAADVANRSQQADGHNTVHTRDGQQPFDLLLLQNGFAQQVLDRCQVLLQPIEFTQALLHSQAFIHRKRLLAKPGAAFVAEQVGCGTMGNQVRSQHAMNLILQPCPVPDDLRAARHLTAQRQRSLVGHPHLRQKAAGVQLRQDRRVDLVRLDPGFCDQPDLQRIGDHHFGHVRLQSRHDGSRIAGGFKNHFVAGPQALCEALELGVLQHHSPARAQQAILQVGNLAKGARDVQSNHSHGQPPCVGWNTSPWKLWAARQLRIRARSATGGQLLTRALGSSYKTACPRFMLPGAPVPDGLTICWNRRGRWGAKAHHAGYQCHRVGEHGAEEADQKPRLIPQR